MAKTLVKTRTPPRATKPAAGVVCVGKSGVPARKPRADAQRNRERIIEVARGAFSRHGALATLDEIARSAGIGPGTLYRHFPTREDLIEAVYRNEVAKLIDAATTFTEKLAPLAGLRAWMMLFVDHVAQKKLIWSAMESVPGGSTRLLDGARRPIEKAFRGLVERAIREGDLRRDTQPGDLHRALVGVFYTTAMPGWEESARRIIDMLLAGCRASSLP